MNTRAADLLATASKLISMAERLLEAETRPTPRRRRRRAPRSYYTAENRPLTEQERNAAFAEIRANLASQ